MLADVLSKLAGLLAAVSLYGALAAALTWVTMSAAHVPTRVLHQGLVTYLYQLRRRHYLDLGLYPRWSRLRRQVRFEATALLRQQALLSTPTDQGALPRWLVIDTPWYQDEATLERLVDRVFPDVREESREELCHGLRHVDLPLGKRMVFLNRLVSLLWSVVLLILFPLDALAFVSSSTTGALDPFRELSTSPALWPGTQAPSGQLVGMGITAIIATLTAGAAMRPFMKAIDRATPPRQRKAPPPRSEPVAEEKGQPPIGRPGCAVRALNFAGGAFDTVMQLGVAHALLVIQGRAPDAVVGVSAGALNAAALAEIIQAGEENERRFYGERQTLDLDAGARWEKLTDEDKKTLQRNRLLARTYRLRDFVAAAQRAPELLVDAVVPDVYQIETTRPLRPLDQPRFAPEERRKRAEAAIARSGLVGLYNDLLGIPFSIGTLTRLTRRILGILAASEIRAASKLGSWVARNFVRFVEILRIWVLLGLNLGKTTPVVAVLLRAFRRRRTTTATAGALIFRFNVIRKIWRGTKYFFLFFALLVFWVGWSILPFEIAALISEITELDLPSVLAFTLALYLVPLPLWQFFRRTLLDFDRTTVGAAALEAVRGTAAFLIATILWSALLTALLGLPFYLLRQPVQGQAQWIELGVSLLLLEGALWLMTVIIVVSLGLNGKLHDRPFIERLLAFYSLDDALLREHGLRVYLVRLFDPGYYGDSDLDSAVERALGDELEGADRPRKDVEKNRKLISHYADSMRRLEPIHVGVAVASTSTGSLDPVAPNQSIVKALLAAVSITPVFPAIELDGQLVVDGTNVANEPSRALWGLLRKRVNKESKVIHIYSVSPFPVSSSGLGKEKEATRHRPDSTPADATPASRAPEKLGFYLNLVDVALRARRLQRFRDATLERKLTELFTRVIPPSTSRVDVDNESYYRAWVTPIELENHRNFTRRILWAPKELRHQAIAETIADGCRAALQVMIPDAIEQAARGDSEGHGLRIYEDRQEWIAPCGAAVTQHLESRRVDAVGDLPLPGSDARVGPGLKEICRHCRIWRQELPNGDDEHLRDALRARNDGSLRLGKWQRHGPPWPHEREYGGEALEGDPHFVPCDDERDKETLRALEDLRARQQDASKQVSSGGQKVETWPKKRGEKAGDERPIVSFLFSGGVFRGVYQLGVLNALNDLGLEPDVIAGASVGSITAAMVAETFSLRNDLSPQQETPNRRCVRIRQLAATYLAVDRLILTDRFADFIRDLTLRAAEARFSIRQADRLFRNYDYPAFREFDLNARRVVAGLERLLYLNPFQLTELVRTIRNHDLKGATLHLRELAQQFLDRMNVGDEVLGAEALRELIEHYVTGHRETGHPVNLTFDDLRAQCGIQYIATATNLTEGRLEILGERPVSDDDEHPNPPLLLEGLLASSAFPGVFRPRWSWALYPNSSDHHQYIDGGVMDNLPIDAVVQFLARAAEAGLIARRPVSSGQARPHLVVAVSLEVSVRPYDLAWTRRRLKRSWLALRRRAKELRYNRKLDTYAAAESRLRSIYEALHQQTESADSPPHVGLEPVDLEVIAIKPEWLCGTFAFHPMLGFRRRKQAQSIAHGCASTLLTFAATRADKVRGAFLKDLGMSESRIPTVSSWTEAFRRWRQSKNSVAPGRCWLRKDVDCPFGEESLRQGEKKKQPGARERPLSGKNIKALSQIYEECIKFRTHVRTI